MAIKSHLKILRDAFSGCRRRFGPRVRSKMARSLRRTLLTFGLSSAATCKIVRRVAGVEPPEWVGASEIAAAFRELGIPKDRRYLHWLQKKKAALIPGQVYETYFDADGNRGHLSQLSAPVVKLKIKNKKFSLEKLRSDL